eukprot:COSAG06_NODE_5005_length_3795_cov_116.758089_5_plen_127_part_01
MRTQMAYVPGYVLYLGTNLLLSIRISSVRVVGWLDARPLAAASGGRSRSRALGGSSQCAHTWRNTSARGEQGRGARRGDAGRACAGGRHPARRGMGAGRGGRPQRKQIGRRMRHHRLGAPLPLGTDP